MPTDQPSNPGMFVAARPSTAAQHKRYERIVRAAGEILLGGEEALQMKDLAAASNVSLTALYRYFPSKDHVMVAVAAHRYETAFARWEGRRYEGNSVRERVADFLLRTFAREQEVPLLSAAMHRVLAASDQLVSADVFEYVFKIISSHLRSTAGPFTMEQELVLPIIIEIRAAAARAWLAERVSTEEATMTMLLGSRLLDLTPAILDQDRTVARSWVATGSLAG